MKLTPAGAPLESTVFTPEIEEAGKYEVYAWWTADARQVTDAKYTINYDGGSQWNYLGTFLFAEGSFDNITVAGEAKGNVNTYAIKLKWVQVIKDRIYYHHNDHLGTPLAMTNKNATVVWKASYTPFGEAEIDPSSTKTNNFRFPGQYYDQESGLHYN